MPNWLEMAAGARNRPTQKLEVSLSNSYTLGCPPVRGDNPRALASGLSYLQVDKHGITILCHLHQCRPCTSRDFYSKVRKGGISTETTLKLKAFTLGKWFIT